MSNPIAYMQQSKSRFRLLFQLSIVAFSMTQHSIAHADSEPYTKGYVGAVGHYYPENGLGVQNDGDVALVAEIETKIMLFENANVLIKPYLRYDPVNDNRNSAQIKEFDFEYRNNNNYLNIGQRILGWSTTEAVNVLPIVIADIINQRDYDADADGQQKLGRPAVTVSHLNENILLQLHYFPYFTASAYGDIESRESFASGQFDINENPIYAGENAEREKSAALRIELQSQNSNLSGFIYQGYANTNKFVFSDATLLTPAYDLQRIYGFTSQSTTDNWIFKSELTYHETLESAGPANNKDNFLTGILGAEYTVVLYESDADVALFSEYIYDQRGKKPYASPFANDLFGGIRWSLNNQQSTVVTVGIVKDLDDSTYIVHINYTRRLFDNMSLDLTLRHYAPDEENILSALENDSLIKLGIKYHF